MKKYFLEIWNDLEPGEEVLLAKLEFSDLKTAQEAALTRILKDKKNGLDYAYFIVDEDEEPYSI